MDIEAVQQDEHQKELEEIALHLPYQLGYISYIPLFDFLYIAILLTDYRYLLRIL